MQKKHRCKAKGCGAEIESKYEYCFRHNLEFGHKIIIGTTCTFLKKKQNKEEKKCSECGTDLNVIYVQMSEVDFYKLKVIEKFRYTDEITLQSTRNKLPVMDLLISDLRHLGVEEITKRKIGYEKADRIEGKLEVIKAFIELIAPLKGWKRDLKREGLLE